MNVEVHVIGTLSLEDLGRYCLAYTMYQAIELNPAAFSQAETLLAVRDLNRLHRDLVAKYEFLQVVGAEIDEVTGICTVSYGIEVDD